ncbi:M48 family metalloprotease [bacterium]|nr:M48 family metalloprotease [bacterium]
MNQRVYASRYVARYTGLHLGLAWLVVVLTFGPMVLFTLGFALLFPIIVWALAVWRNRHFETYLRGSGLRVHEQQFPEIYRSVQRQSQQLGLSRCPEVYILEHNQQNALALKNWSKRYVILFDDIVFGALATGNDKVLDFIIGHELAHHALGHTNTIRAMLRGIHRTLGRLDELSCDSVSHALNQDSQAARDALCLLLVGPQLYSKVNRRVLDQEAEQLYRSSAPSAAEKELMLTHPLLLHRYARIQQHPVSLPSSEVAQKEPALSAP